MDLRRRWWRWAFARPHVFILAWPGAGSVRLAAEAHLRRSGWPLALTPADTDILLVAKPPGTDLPTDLTEVVEQFWRGIPLPRRRVLLDDPAGVAMALQAARDELAAGSQDATAAAHKDTANQPGAARAEEMNDTPARSAAHEGMGHEQMGHEQTGHDHMGHGDMPMPAGLPLAEEGPDRDGLNLDQLRISLGPALAHWPAGLRVDLVVQGDLVVEARVIRPEPQPSTQPWWHALPVGPSAAARRLDSLTRLFSVAGVDGLAISAARIRDNLLDGGDPRTARATLARLMLRVRATPLLRSMTARVPVDPDGTLLGLPAPGDLAVRWSQWLAEADRALRDAIAMPGEDVTAVLDALPGLIVGRELAEVRLIVAGLDPDLDGVAGRASDLPTHRHEHSHA